MSVTAGGVIRLLQEIRRNLKRQIGLAVILSVGSCISAGLILAWLLVGTLGWQQGTLAPFTIDVIITIASLIGGLSYIALSRRVTEQSAIVDSMEKETGLPSGLLIGSLQLEQSIPQGVSVTLANHGAEKTLKVLKSSGVNLVGPRGARIERWKKSATMTFVLMCLIIAGLTVVKPQRSINAWLGLFTPIELSAKPVKPPLEVSPGDANFLRGSDVVVSIIAVERIGVTLFRQTVGEILVKESSVVKNAQASFALGKLSAVTEYWIVASDGSESPRFKLNPIDPLLVTDLNLKIEYPDYTGMFAEEYRTPIPHLIVPAGSHIEIEGTASGSLGSASLLREDEEISMQIEDKTFQGAFYPRSSDIYTWLFLGNDGGSAALFPQPIEITVVSDQIPDVEVLLPGKDTLLPVSRIQPLVVQSSDDYGLQRLELSAYKSNVFGDSSGLVVQPIPIGGTRGALVRPVMDFSNWELLPGDTIHYFVRAIDNAPEPNTGSTKEYLLLPRTRAEIQREAQEHLVGVNEKLEEIQSRIGDEVESNQDLETAASNERTGKEAQDDQGNVLGYEDQENFREALEAQRQLLNAIDSLENELAILTKDMKISDLGDLDLEDDLSDLEDLMKELVPEEALEELEEFLDNMAEMDADRAREMFRQLVEEQESLSERLENIENRFKKAALDQDFRATAAQVEELAEQQELLADAIAESTETDFRAEQQEGLEAKLEGLEASLEELQEQLGIAGEVDTQEAILGVQERAEMAKQSMKMAGTELREGNVSDASVKAHDAASELAQMSSEMKRAQEEMVDQSMQVSAQALRQTATDALSLAREQADLREEMRVGRSKSARELRGDELALLNGLQAMADEMTQSIPFGTEQNRVLSTQIGRAMIALQETLESLDAQRGIPPSSPPAVEQVIDGLNQLAFFAMAAGQQAGENGQEGSGEQTMEELQQLAEQQGSVNSQTGQLKPMAIEGQMMESQLRELSGAQEEIAEQLSDLAESSEEPGSLGDLDELALEAMRLAEILAGNRLSPETLRRQERLFQRLLDAGRSLEQDEYSEERESEEPSDVVRGEVRQLTENDMGLLPFEIPNPDIMKELSPAVRQMVLEYFDRINKSVNRRGRIP